MKKLLFPLAISVLSFLISFYILNGKQSPENITLKIEAIVQEDDSFQLFYLTDSKNESFSEEKSLFTEIKGSQEIQTIEFSLPIDLVIDSMRIDLGVNSSQKLISVKNIELSAMNESIKYSPLGSFTSNPYITIQNGDFITSSIEQIYDPYIVSNFNTKNDFLALSQDKDKHEKSFVYLLSLLIATVLFLVVYIVLDIKKAKI